MPRKIPKNINFIKRFTQKASLNILDKDFKTELIKIREQWGIPESGFKSYKEESFLKWINDQQDDNFELVTVIFDDLKIIKCKPKYFLNKILYNIENKEQADDYPTDLYYFENIETFNALIQEKPFPGIVHYILFNNLFIPESNELLLTIDHEYGYPKLIIGPNATMRDIQEFFPIINWMQKSKDYKKNKTRLKKNFLISKKILTDNLKSYEIMDKLNLSDHVSMASKNLSKSRQIKSRSKKYSKNI